MDYLGRLGVSHAYLSPVLEAVGGSEHGYDVVDPTKVRAELGGEGAFEHLSQAARAAGIGLVVDVVPNHMAIGVPENTWWWDVLENGPSSVFASYFDVDWDPHTSTNRVMLPVLGDHYGRVIRAGGLVVTYEDGSFQVRQGGWGAPLAPPSVAGLLASAARGAAAHMPGGITPAQGAEAVAELERIAAELASLAPSDSTATEVVRHRHRAKERLRAELGALVGSRPWLERALDHEIEALNASPEDLDRLLEEQNYRLSYWRGAKSELDYRRFFDIDTLIGMKVEDDLVFADSHALILEWLASGRVDGVRIDHIDGLADPQAYLDRLEEANTGGWIVVEKILGEGETLPDRWPVAGTTGYEFAALVTRLFVDPEGIDSLDRTWRAVSGSEETFAELAHRCKHEVIGEALNPDVQRIVTEVAEVARTVLDWRDYARSEVEVAVAEAIACLSVYRSYVPAEGIAEPVDRARITAAIDEAARRQPDVDGDLWRMLSLMWCGDAPFDGALGGGVRRRWQQVSGAVSAKATEDTAFYRHHRLVALNEVGADPAKTWADQESFHLMCSTRLNRHPDAMLTSSTHDTKRSEDVRARLVVLSEIAEAWEDTVSRWSEMNATYWRGAAPDPAMEYLCYQTMVGILPSTPPEGTAREVLVERVGAYLLKAAREAKTRTSWTAGDGAYEAAVEGYVRAICWDESWMGSACAFVAGGMEEAGWANSLAMLALKLTAPGVPDIYQGCELWDDSLVDPDNRREVDFGARIKLLALAESAPAAKWWAEDIRSGSGISKIGLTQKVLELRRDRPGSLSGPAPFRPIAPSGRASSHLISYRRADDVVVVVPRLVVGLAARSGGSGQGWARWERGGLVAGMAAGAEGTVVDLPPGKWRDVCTGETVDGGAVDAGTLLATFPVSILAREDGR